MKGKKPISNSSSNGITSGTDETASGSGGARGKNYDEMKLERDNLKSENVELKREIERLHAQALKSGSSKCYERMLRLGRKFDDSYFKLILRVIDPLPVSFSSASCVVAQGGLGAGSGRPKSKNAQMAMMVKEQLLKKRKGVSALNPRMKK